MPSTPNNLDPASHSPPVTLSAAFLALRERSRILLRERSIQLQELESRLQDQLAKFVAESNAQQAVHTDSESSRKQIESLESEIRHLQQLRRDSEKALDEARTMLVEMEDERRALCERLDAAEVARNQPVDHGSGEETERLQRRLEMATQEIRELKHQLQEQSSRPSHSAPAPSSRAPAADLKSFDWETQKKRLLQELETDFDTAQPAQAREKLRMEEVIRETDRIIAEKDRELDELRQLVETHSAGTIAQAATDDAAREKLLGADEAVTAERAKLLQLQEEWREKLRKSEVEISIERAKLARERLQLEEKIRALPVHSDHSEDGRKTDDSKSNVPPRGRWLNRLGLGGSE